MVRLAYPKERESRLKERWSRPNPGFEKDGPASVHVSMCPLVTLKCGQVMHVAMH